MKYLVIVKPREAMAQTVSSAVSQAHEEYLNRRLASGVADCTYSFVTGGGMSIVNAESHEHLAELPRQAPMYLFHERQIFPLCDFNMTIDMTLDLLRQQSR